MESFLKEDWRYTPYADAKEELPPTTPEHRGCSRTGYILYLNNAPIYWYFKKQGDIETSSFGAEFIVLKQHMEYIRGLRYKLWMVAIPMERPTFIFGDNHLVVANLSKPDSVLKKGKLLYKREPLQMSGVLAISIQMIMLQI
eukprot:443270-Ditylum_brightwellii.AAC.1